MSGWPRVPLGEIARLTYRGEAPDPERKYRLIGVRWWGEGAYEYKTLSGSETQAPTLYRVEENDLVINKIWARHGSIAVAGRSLAGAYGSSEFPTFVLDPARVAPRFIHWFSKTSDAWAQCANLSRGTSGKNRVKPERFLTITAPLPSLSEQQAIVERLDSAATHVEFAKAAIASIDANLLQAARNIIWQAGRRLDAGHPCGSFLHLRPHDVRVEADTEYQFAGVLSFGRGVFKADRKQGSTFSYTTLTRLRAGDFVYPKLMAWEGALGVVPDECGGMVVSPEFPVFEIDRSIVAPAIVDTFFRDPRILPTLQSASAGTNMRRRRIQPSRFLELKMPIPTPDDQRTVLDLLARRQSVVERHSKTMRSLDRLLPAMLHEVFGG